MKIIVAPDKFKGSLSSFELCENIAATLNKKGHEVICLPLADGGDGLLDVIAYYDTYDEVQLEVSDPLFRKIHSRYKISKDGKRAIIEMAEASGLHLLHNKERNCMYTTTYGTGELIRHAIRQGVEEILLGIGGSATNDCGIGMATALGYRFLDKNGKEVQPVGKNLQKIAHIETTEREKGIDTVKMKVACDVENPLCGPQGAAYVYARQKGASDADIQLLDAGLCAFSDLINKEMNIKVAQIKGSGAAGGMGAGTVAFLKAELQKGTELLFEISKIEKHLADADMLIFAEGKIDQQSFMGKILGGLHQLSDKHQVKLAVLSGKCELTSKELQEKKITLIGELMTVARNYEDSHKHAKDYVLQLMADFAEEKV